MSVPGTDTRLTTVPHIRLSDFTCRTSQFCYKVQSFVIYKSTKSSPWRTQFEAAFYQHDSFDLPVYLVLSTLLINLTKMPSLTGTNGDNGSNGHHNGNGNGTESSSHNLTTNIDLRGLTPAPVTPFNVGYSPSPTTHPAQALTSTRLTAALTSTLANVSVPG